MLLPGGPAVRWQAAALTTAAVGAACVQELRSQMEADERRKQQQRALRTPVEVPAVGAVPQPRNKLPGVRGATPPERAARAPLGAVGGRPQSGRRAELQAAQVDSRSPRQRAREAQPREAANAPPRFGGAGAEEGGSGQRVLEQEVQHLTHQVQELLVGLHGRVLLLEQDLSVKTRDNSALVDRLQGLELDNVSLRAEVKMLAPGERVANLERDMAQKLHAHLEHVTSVESERVASALQRMHQLQLDAQEERRKSELAQEALQQQQETIASLEERLRAVEASETLGLRQQSQEHENRSVEHARMEVRINELEASLKTLSVKGEQVVRDTGQVMEKMVEGASAAVLAQLQQNVAALTSQIGAVEHQLLLRGSDIAHRTEEEGQQRVRSLQELEATMMQHMQQLQAEVAGVKGERERVMAAMRDADDSVLAHVRAAVATMEEASASSIVRVDAAVTRTRKECEEEIARQAAKSEESRSFLEEVVRAEIRGRLQGQEALARRCTEMEEVGRRDEVREAEHKETFTMLKLLQAKAKAHSKSLRMLASELDSAKRTAKSGEEDVQAQVRACVQAIKEAEEHAEKSLVLQAQAARDDRAILATRVQALEEGRGEILDKITREVDANRLADNERAKDVTERIESLQRALDACVDMCQSDLRDVHEAHHALEHRLDREAEGLEGLMDRTARDLTRALDSKLQASMKEAVDTLANDLQAEIGGLKTSLHRTDDEVKEARHRVEAQRQGLEHKIRAAQHQVEESEARVNLSLKRVRDEALHNTQSYSARFDALDEQLHAARALAGQHKVEAVERDLQLDGKLRRLEQELLHAGGSGGGAQSALRLLDVEQPLDLLAPTPAPLDESTGKAGEAGLAGTAGSMGPGATTGGATRLSGGAGGIIGSIQGEIENFRKHVLLELQDLHQKIAEGSERMSDTRKQLSETEGRLGTRTDTVWEETRQQWEAVSKRLQDESRALQEQLAVQRQVEQDHRDELDAAIRAEAEARAAASMAATRDLEAAVFDLRKQLEGVGGVEQHIGEARAEAKEALAELRQLLDDEAMRREEQDKDLVARLDNTEEAVRLLEERERALVEAKENEGKEREEALAAALQRVKTGVEDLVVRAEQMEGVQRQHSTDLAAQHLGLNKQLEQLSRHTVQIADAHRRDIDRVCREAECGTVLSGLIDRTAALVLEEQRAADTHAVHAHLEEGLKALEKEMVTQVIPDKVKEEVGELMTLKLLPLQYTVTDLQTHLSDVENDATRFHDETSNKLDIMKGVQEEHTSEHRKHTESAEKTADELQQLGTVVAEQRAAHTARFDSAEGDIVAAHAGAVVEGMVRVLEAEDGASFVSKMQNLQDRLASEVLERKEHLRQFALQVDGLQGKAGELETKQNEHEQGLAKLEAKQNEQEQGLTNVMELVAGDDEEEDVKDKLESVSARVDRLEQQLQDFEGASTLASPIAARSPSLRASDGVSDEKMAKQLAREERAALGGGDMDTIDEDAEEAASPQEAASSPKAAPGDEQGDVQESAGGDGQEAAGVPDDTAAADAGGGEAGPAEEGAPALGQAADAATVEPAAGTGSGDGEAVGGGDDA